MLERGKLFAATTKDRPVMHSMHLIIVDGHVRAEATDGFALMVHTVDALNAEGNAETLLDLKDISAALKGLPRATNRTAPDTVEIIVAGGVGGGVTIDGTSYKGAPGTFPNIDKLVPRSNDEPVPQFGIAGQMLERVGKMGRLSPGSGAIRMHMSESAKSPMTFTVNDSDRSRAVAVVRPMFIDLLSL